MCTGTFFDTVNVINHAVIFFLRETVFYLFVMVEEYEKEYTQMIERLECRAR